jgi:hypothetical protein
MKRLKMLIVLCLIAAFLPACGLKIQKKEEHIEAIQNNPVNCETAEADIKVLEDEKANVGERIVAGVTSIIPVSAVLGILTLTEDDKIQMAVGHYNKLIETRIEKIKTDCGLE